MRKILELALQHARGPFTSGQVNPGKTKGPGVVEGPSNYSTARRAGNSTTPMSKQSGTSSWRGGKVGPIKGGDPLGKATTHPGTSLSAGSKGGGKLKSGKGGLDKDGNDNTPSKMIRTQHKVRVRLGKVMD